MPRNRKHDRTIPVHIEQKKLPIGVYWDQRDHYWYSIARNPKPSRVRIASSDALMSDLHKAMEIARGVDGSTLDYMLGMFADSAKYKRLSQSSQDDYAYCRRALQQHKTKLGVPFASLKRSMVTMPLIQRLVDSIAETKPSKSNHIKRYLSAAFQWGMQRGHATSNPAKGVAQATERKAHRMPAADTARAVIKLLRERGALPARRKGSVPPYLWAVAEIAYQCRMRSLEVRDLTDDDALEDGLRVRRRKGSLDNVTRWSSELRTAWNWLVSRRESIWQKKRNEQPKGNYPVVVSEDGSPLSKSALNSAWRRAMAVAIEAGTIDAKSRFGLHGLKHRGVTDTIGGKAAKKEASGHKTDAMLHLYDHEVPVVDPAGKRH